MRGEERLESEERLAQGERGSPRGAGGVMGSMPVWMLSQLTICLCGHLSEISLIFTVPAAVLAWWGFVRLKHGWGWRMMGIGMAVLTGFTLVKNVGDILWWGHEPWF